MSLKDKKEAWDIVTKNINEGSGGADTSWEDEKGNKLHYKIY